MNKEDILTQINNLLSGGRTVLLPSTLTWEEFTVLAQDVYPDLLAKAIETTPPLNLVATLPTYLENGTVANLIHRLSRLPPDTQVEYVIAEPTGELVNIHLQTKSLVKQLQQLLKTFT